MKYVIFLDLDGVMHPTGSCVWNDQTQTMATHGAFRWWPILEELIAQVGVKIDIVIHSTWRFMFEHDDALRAVLPASMQSYVLGATNRNCMGRERSILDYLASNQVDHFLVLDDEPGAFAKDYAPLIVCQGTRGISDINVVNVLRERMGQWPMVQYQYGVS